MTINNTCAAQHFGAWACDPKWLQQAISAVQAGTWKPEAAKVRDPNEKPYGVSGPQSDMAIVSIAGQIMKGQSSFGGASSVMTRRALRAAADDSAIKSILLVIDSTGGTVAGTGDLADDVSTIDHIKPVYAYIEDLAASAAYWVASQTRAIFANPTAIIGCIGVYSVLEDTTGMQDKEGVKLTVVATGEYKGLGADGKVSDKLIEDVQRENDDFNESFMNAIAKGRAMSSKEVSGVADGRVWIADKAQELGLIDEVASIDAAMMAITQRVMKMTKEQFESSLAEHPDWAAGEREKGKKAGIAEARSAEITRAKAIREACKGNDGLAYDTFIAGKDAEDATLAIAAVAKARTDADATIAAQAKEIDKLKAQIGTQGAIATAGAIADAEKEKTATPPAPVAKGPKAEAEAQAAQEWQNKASGTEKFATKEKYVFYRTLVLTGQHVE